jgi:molybdopterin biosynthesis enzyme
MLGDPRPHRPSARVRLQTAFSHRTGRTELVRATLEERDGELWAQPKPRQGSGSLTSMTTLDALLVVPADRERIAAGDSLHAVLCGFPTGRREPIVAAG